MYFIVKSKTANPFFMWLDEDGESVGENELRLVRKLGRSIEGWDSRGRRAGK
jgi:hypothetical protein